MVLHELVLEGLESLVGVVGLADGGAGLGELLGGAVEEVDVTHPVAVFAKFAVEVHDGA